MNFNSRRAAAWLPTLVVVLALQACGGGGGSAAVNAPPPPSALTYATPPSYLVDAAITPLDPAVTGEPTSYSIAPALPAGLTLDATTGRISGTPTAPAKPRTYTVTAKNAGGSTTFALTLGVLIERATADRADDHGGLQVHALYVLPSDGTDEQLDQLGTIEGSVRSWNAWFATQTGGKELRLDTSNGRLDVSFLRVNKTKDELAATGGNVRTKLEYLLLANGFTAVDKVYLVYYGGKGDGCGRGAWPPTIHGTVGALYLDSDSGCMSQPFSAADEPPKFLEFLGVHEVLHVLGFAAPCAPHHTESGHIGDSTADVMYSGTQPWVPTTLDVNHDDYYGVGLSSCRDLANSALLEPPPAGAEQPAAWPYANLADAGCANEATTIPGPYGADTSVTFVNAYTDAGGATPSITINELVLNTGTGLYAHVSKGTVPSFDGVTLVTRENAVYVATVNGQCVGVARAAAAPGRFVVQPEGG